MLRRFVAPKSAVRAPTTQRRTGDSFEDRALGFLEAQGLMLVNRNWRASTGEIDLVMRADRALVFVEVRKRSSARFGSALESINASKRLRLEKTIEHYLSKLPARPDYRVDAVTFDADDQAVWTKNIFD
jgi:putative endonuclease